MRKQLPNIAIIGGTRSGKDTAYQYIKSLGYPVACSFRGCNEGDVP